MRRLVAIAGLAATLSLGSAPALAFQETPVPPTPGAEAVPETAPPPPSLQLGTPGAAQTDPQADRHGLKLFGYTILPKLDFGLDVMYGQEQVQLQGPTALEENGDVTVLGKVKRRF
ncbi:MAG TPA: hypothetical protein VFD26_08495 [Methyloceanibacter sp.]|nr:hypothetical protein [Methyloceanibacter sp.]